jgi:hypothetical protein
LSNMGCGTHLFGWAPVTVCAAPQWQLHNDQIVIGARRSRGRARPFTVSV